MSSYFITDIAELSDRVDNVDVNANISYFNQGFEYAQEQYLKSILQPTLYASLLSDYISNANKRNSMSAANNALLPYVQNLTAFFSVYDSLDRRKVTVSDASVTILSDSNRKTAFQNQIDDLKANLELRGYQAIQSLYDFLLTNQSDYAAWDKSEYYQFFISSAKECKSYTHIIGSRKEFELLKPYINKSQTILEKSIGDTFQAELLAARQAENETADQLTAINKIKPYLIHQSVYEFLQSGSGYLTTDGLFITNIDAISENKRVKTLADSKHKMAYHKNQAAYYANDLKEFLDKNADNYTTYKNSDHYTDPTSGSTSVENENQTVFFL